MNSVLNIINKILNGIIDKMICIINYTFKNKLIKNFIKYYNFIFLFVYTFGCYFYMLNKVSLQNMYIIFVSFFGFNIMTLLLNGYILYKFKFCRWQILAYTFNWIISILYIIDNILFKYGINLDNTNLISSVLYTTLTIFVIKIYIDEFKISRRCMDRNN